MLQKNPNETTSLGQTMTNSNKNNNSDRHNNNNNNNSSNNNNSEGTVAGAIRQEFKITCLQLLCGGIAGATARTVVSPVDRVKLLIQTARVRGEAPKSVMGTATHEIVNNGVRSLWRGNLTNCVRVFPYAAIQFASYDRYKSWVVDWCDSQGRSFGHVERLVAGGLAGGTAATLTYPLDVMRLVQAVVPEAKSPTLAMQYIYRSGGLAAFYKGWIPTVMSLGPYIGINFATFDYLKQTFLPQGNTKAGSSIVILFLGAGAGLFAQSVCYPLDTIRRVMQIPDSQYKGMYDCCYSIIKKDGIVGMYRGMIPNAIKIVPNNGIRFWVYTYLTTYLKIPKKGGGGD